VRKNFLLNPQLMTAVYFAIIGSMLGSFLNVCLYRLPRGESIVRPRSRCPECGTPVRIYDNIPVISYFILRGRCRNCRAAIPVQYPLVEAGCAVLAAAAWLKSGSSPQAGADALFLILLLGIATADLRTYTIPDSFSLSGLLLGLAFSFLPGGMTPLESVIGILAGGGSLYLLGLVGGLILRREAMGGGDVKMIAMIGAFTGWPGVVFTIFMGSLSGSLVFGWINYVLKRDKLVPFGVFLALGAGIHLFWGQWLIEWYLGLFSPEAIEFFFSGGSG